MKPRHFWIITLLAIGFVFLPCKISDFNPDLSRKNEVLISFTASTCTAECYVGGGYIEIPNELQSVFHDTIGEVNLSGNCTDLKDYEYNWYLGYQYLVKGSLVGADTSMVRYGCDPYPLFKVDTWTPTSYFPIILAFNSTTIKIYFLSIVSMIAISLIWTIIRKVKNK